jgi:chromosome segregation protein
MKHIDFLLAGVENYCQFKEPREFFFEKGITIISGPNGIGKTNLMDSLGFTHYGVTSKGLKGSDVVNNRVGKNCHTWTKFQNRETKDIYRVDRYYSHKDHGNSVHVWREGVKEPLESKTLEANKLIEQLTLPPKLFFNRISFGQKIKTFFTALPQGEQRDIFRKLFALELYEIWHKMTDTTFKEEKNILEEILLGLRTDFSLLEREKELLEQIKEEKEIFYKTKEETLKSLLKEINEKLNYQNSLSSVIQNLNESNCDEKHSSVSAKISSIKSELEKINNVKEEKINDLKKKGQAETEQIISKLDNKFLTEEKEFTSKIEAIRKEYYDKIIVIDKERSELRNKSGVLTNSLETDSKSIKSLNSEIEEYKSNLKDSICPTCNQPIAGKNKEFIENKLKQKQQEEGDLKLRVDKNSKQVEEISNKIEKCDDDISKLDNERSNKVSEIEIKISSLKSKIEDSKSSEIAKIKSKFKEDLSNIELEFSEKQKSLKEEIQTLEKEELELSKIISKKNEYENEYSSISAKISEISKRYDNEYNKEFDNDKIKKVEANIFKLKSSIKSGETNKLKKERRLRVLQGVKDAFAPSGVPNYLIGTGIPFMNQRCAELLDSVSQGRYSIVFDAVSQTKAGEFRDKIGTNTFDTQNLTKDRKQISGGQERLIDVCVLIALNDLHSKVHQIDFNVLILDEVFDSLDDNNILSISNLLSLLAKEKSINIISHTHIDGIQADRYFYF